MAAIPFRDVNYLPAVLSKSAEFAGKSRILVEDCGLERATEYPINPYLVRILQVGRTENHGFTRGGGEYAGGSPLASEALLPLTS